MNRRRALVTVLSSAATPVTPWYRTGGAPAPSGAFQSTGVASQAASYVNLANPGTNDLTTTNAPKWTVYDGWNYDDPGMFLQSGITWNTQNTVIVRFHGIFSTVADRTLVATANFGILGASGNNHYFMNGGGWLSVSGGIQNGAVLAIAGNKAYRDGVEEGTITTGVVSQTPVTIGNNAAHNRFCFGYIDAIVFYDTVLTAEQVAAVSTAMEILPLTGSYSVTNQDLYNQLFAATCTNAAGALTIPTYDGSGQVVHPDVLDAGVAGWNGYRYWMAMTPYNGSDPELENPSIVASNDKTTWEVPAGLTNPIVASPAGAGFNADPDLLIVNNVMYCFYLWRTLEPTVDHVSVISSADGVTWGTPTELTELQSVAQHSSPAVVYLNGTWIMWFYKTNTSYGRITASSPTGPWSAETIITINPSNLSGNHLDIIRASNGAYYGVFMEQGAGIGYLKLAASLDGLIWVMRAANILQKGTAGAWDDYGLYRASLVETATGFDLYYTGKASLNEWLVGLTTIAMTF